MVDGVSSTNEATGRTNAGRTGLVSNFETFLTLLTTQLKNQDPLSPMESTEFTAQLTQMSGVEQQLLTNDLLTSLLAAQQAGGLGTASNYLGKTATAAWSATELTDGQATWSYELATNAATATLQVVDGTGKVVWTGDAPDKTTGVHDFTWDGKSTAGGQLPDGGVYTLKVVAKTAGDQTVDSQVLTRGRVTGVEMFNGQPFLTIGNAIVPVSTLIALDEAGAATPTPDTNDDGNAVSALLSNLNPMKLFS